MVSYSNVCRRTFYFVLFVAFQLDGMSSQKGNASRNRPQKHQNRFAFKNNLHDTNIRTKRLNTIQIHHVCPRCKDILEWKIKYKKYKMLKAAKNCNKCHNKTVKEAYHTVCQPCSGELAICPKCAVPRIEWAKDGSGTRPPSEDGSDDRENDDSATNKTPSESQSDDRENYDSTTHETDRNPSPS